MNPMNFTKKISILALVSGFAAVAQAAPQKPFYSCGSVDGNEDLKIYVELKTKAAAYFDGDTSVVLPLVRKEKLVADKHFSIPILIFEGDDPAGESNTRIRITLDQLSLSAYVTQGISVTTFGSTKMAAERCKLDRRFPL